MQSSDPNSENKKNLILEILEISENIEDISSNNRFLYFVTNKWFLNFKLCTTTINFSIM